MSFNFNARRTDMRTILAILLALATACPAFAQVAVESVNGVAATQSNRALVLSESMVLSSKGITISTTGDQATIALPTGVSKFAITAFIVTNCSGTPLLAQVALYTAAGGTGTNAVAATTITAASSASAMVNATIATPNTALTSSSLFVRIVVANTAAVTCDMYVVVNNLT